MTEHQITLTYLNIRQSIAILLARIILTDILTSSVIVLIYLLLIQGDRYLMAASTYSFLFLTVFVLTGVIKLVLNIYTVLLWLNEYYEITPDYIIHRSGIFFRKTEKYKLDLVRVLHVHDSLLGEMFNFGTLTIYDIRLKKYLDMYLIHNPRRYARVLEQLKQDIEVKEDSIHTPFKSDESVENTS